MDGVKPLRRLRSVGPDPSPAQRQTAAMAEAAKGDQAAFAVLYDDLAPIVFGVVRQVVRDPAQSEEITQEVFVEVWRLAPRFDRTRGSVRAWVCTIAHRRAVDAVRAEQSARDRDQRDASRQAVAHDTVSDGVIDDLDRDRVKVALEKLSPVQREAIELAYYGGNTYREVAVLLDCAEGTVKTRIRDGLIHLRDAMGVMT